MYKRTAEGWAKHWDFILLDTICLQVAYILAYFIRFGFGQFVYNFEDYRNVGMWLALFSIMVAVTFNTMHTVLRRSVMQEIRRTIAQCLLVFALIIIFLFSTKDSETVSRIAVYVTIGLYLVLSFVTRMLYKGFLIKHKLFGKKREILLVTENQASAIEVIDRFNNRPEESINICGIVLIDEENASEINGVPVVATLENAADYICTQWIDEVYIAVSDYSSMPVELMTHCAEMGVTVHQQLIQLTDVKGKKRVERIAQQPVLTSSISMAKPWQLAVKRIVDIIGGLFLSIVAVFAIIILVPIIKTRSNGPVLLKQERIGQNGRKFRMLSIRTMYMDAGKRIREWKEKHPDTIMTVKNDPRIIGNKTLDNGVQHNGLGLAIRKMGLDNIPQAFNVLIGQMSLVGTRAPSVEEWEKYQYHHRARLACKPGITGLWQASGKSRSMTFEEATALDTEYITNWSLGLDWRILFKTVGVEKKQKG